MKKIIFALFILIPFTFAYPLTWTPKTGISAGGRKLSKSFAIGNYGYVTLGQRFNDLHETWEYNTTTDTWTQKANCNITKTLYGIAFSVNGKGYVAGGGSGIYINEVWEFDPAANTWTQKNNFPGGGRIYMTGFSIGNKGYAGWGGDTSGTVFQDLWEYESTTDTWTQKNNTLLSLSNSTAFSTSTNAYVLQNGTNILYNYDPVSDSWSQLDSMPGPICFDPASFAIGSLGYAGMGRTSTYNNLTNWYEYNTVTNVWTSVGFMSSGSQNGITFSVNGKGYFGTGYDGSSFLDNLYECESIVTADFVADHDTICPCDTILLSNTSVSALNLEWKLNGVTFSNITPASFSNCTPGVYIITLVASNTTSIDSISKPIVVNPPVWNRVADLPGLARSNAGFFSINNKGYVAMGYVGLTNTVTNELWEYDPVTDSWTQKSPFTGTVRDFTTSFSIGTDGYITCGIDYSPYFFLNDLWKYNSLTNSWTQQASIPDSIRHSSAGFSINGYGYVATGWTGSYNNDLWRYDPAANSWTARAHFPGSARYDAVALTIGNKGYVGSGFSSSGGQQNDWWEYNPLTDSWLQKASIPGPARSDASGFAINDYGYILCGQGNGSDDPFRNLWEYNSLTDTWTEKERFCGDNRSGACTFVLNGKGYIGLDSGSDLWQYTPGNYVTAIEFNSLLENFIQVNPNPCSDKTVISFSAEEKNAPEISLFDISGKNVSENVQVASMHSALNGNKEMTLMFSDLADGVYVINVRVNGKMYQKKLLVRKD